MNRLAAITQRVNHERELVAGMSVADRLAHDLDVMAETIGEINKDVKQSGYEPQIVEYLSFVPDIARDAKSAKWLFDRQQGEL